MLSYRPSLSADLASFCRLAVNGLLPALTAVHRLLLPCFLSLWLINWLSKAWERVGVATQFYANWDAAKYDLYVATAIAVLIGLLKFSEHRGRRLFALEADWTRLLRTNPTLSWLRIGYLLVSCVTFLVFSAFFATCIFDNGAKALACFMSDTGNYELAERIYRVAPDLSHNKADGRYSSMAAWHSSQAHEDPAMLRKKNAAVSMVYGAQSREMGCRYFYLGLTCIHGAVDRDAEVIYWQTKALAVHEHNRSVTKCIDVLAQMAIYQSDKQETKRLLAHAARLAPSMEEAPYVCTDILQWLAKRNGDREQAELFRRSFARKLPVDQSTLQWQLVSWVLLVFLAICSSGLGCSFAKRQALGYMTRNADEDCAAAVDSNEQQNVLSRIITLNLIGRNLYAAQQNSLRLLTIAESHQAIVPWISDSNPVTPEYSSSIVRHELFKVLFAVAVVWWF